MERKTKRIAVIGMGRSGTSFVTNFLAACGVYVDEAGPEKYEHPMGRRINDTILEEEFGAKKGLPYGKLPEGRIEVPEKWHKEAEKFIELMDERAEKAGISGYWAFKDPRTTVLHELWIRHFDIVIGVFRTPEEVVKSYLARGWIKGLWKKQAMALGYWLRFNQALLEVWRNLEGKKPMYVMDFNGDIRTQLSNLGEKLKIAVPENALSIYDTKQKHFSKDKPIEDEMVEKIYNELKKINKLI